MATTVTMPQLGETVTEGTVLRWAKQVGDSVAEDEVLVEISTDKVDTEVPSPAAGVVLEILVPEGETVAVGSPLAVIGEPAEAGGAPAAGAPAEPETASPPSEPEPAQVDEPLPAPPAPRPVTTTEVAAAPPPAAATGVTVTMPQLGETVTEGTVLRWAKQVGDTVAEDEVLVEISTDKVDTEVPSPAAGVVLEILVPEGETVAVGSPLAVIGQAVPAAGAAPSAPPAVEPEPAEPEVAPAAVEPAPASIAASQAPTEPAPQSQPERVAAGRTGRAVGSDGAHLFLSPVVRKLVREYNLDPSQIEGTGRDGRITRNDVLAYIERHQGAPAPAAPAPAAPVPEAPAPAAPAPAAPVPEAPAPAAPAPAAGTPASGEEEREIDRLRALIGANMIRAKQTAAHVWTSVEVDYSAVERVRQQYRESFKAEEGFSLTYLPFVARATMDALRTYPVVNSSFFLEERKAVFHHDINLGIAVDLNQQGLVVASVRQADSLRLRGLARAIRAKADKARNNKLEPNDISGSTFTITNPGPYGSFLSAPIINVPNVAILSTDTVTKRPTVVTSADGQDTIAIRHIGYLGLSWDHRAFDGSTAVLFLQRIKHNLETWDWEQELL